MLLMSAYLLDSLSNKLPSVMKDPKDILLMDLDNQGRWSILTKDQIDKILRGH